MPQTMRLADGEKKRALPKRLTFTLASLRDIKPPAKGRLWVYDTRERGLALMVTENDARAFYVYRKVKGRPERIRLGAFDELTIEQARDRASEKILDIRAGLDPMAQKRATAEGMTLGEAWAYFLEHHAKPHLKDVAKCEERYRLYLSKMASRRLEDLDRAAVVALHNKIGATNERAVVEVDGHKYKVRRGGKGVANRVLGLLSSIIGTVKRDGKFTGPNPCESVRRFREEERVRFLQPDEMPRFYAALKTYSDQTIADFYRVSLLVGARRRNVQMMTWASLNLDAATWTIPGAMFKNGRPQRVKLPAQVVTILKARKDNGSPWVFHSTTSKSGHIESTYKAWETICKDAKLEGIRPHDLRRSTAVYMLASGASSPTVAAQLGHLSIQSAAKYQKLDLTPVEQAINAGATAIMAASKPAKPKGKSKEKGASKK